MGGCSSSSSHVRMCGTRTCSKMVCYDTMRLRHRASLPDLMIRDALVQPLQRVPLTEATSNVTAKSTQLKDRKSTRLNSSHSQISYAVFCLKKKTLPDLLEEFGFEAQTFSSAEEFLASKSIAETRCLVLDVAMPGMTGPDLQRELKNRDQSVPIVFITAHRDAALRPRLIAQGAVDCLFKPFEPADLLQALNTALQAS